MQFTHALLLAAISGSALADFLIGNCASSDLGESPGVQGIALPGGLIDCDYVAIPLGGNICQQNVTLPPTNNGGICPGDQHERSLNFCSAPLYGSGCPKTFQMGFNSRDDCGDIALANHVLPPDGSFYSDLIDTARQNIAIGRCVYEQAKEGEVTCPGDENGVKKCATFIKCYTEQYGTKEC